MLSRRDFTKAAVGATATAAAAEALAKEEEDQSRVATIFVSERMLLEVLQGKLRLSGWPDDARFIAAEYSIQWRGFRVLIQSSQFEPVPMGENAPHYAPGLKWERPGIPA